MGCACCKDDVPVVREQPQPRPHLVPKPRPKPPVTTKCEFCGRVLDPSLIDGHRETCRTNHRRAMAAAEASKPTPASPGYGACDDDADLCIICMEKPKGYALVPCGHVIGCMACVTQLTTCPICREPRSGVLSIALDASKPKVCKHCKHLLSPTFFDGHMEVCALRMRMNRPGAGEESPTMRPDNAPLLASDGDALLGPSVEARLCGECGKAPQDAALIPCGHMFCAGCAGTLKVCPLCLVDVTSTIKTYM
jgi:hypothetical protein